MNFKFALELGLDCDLETVGEAIYNVRLRVGQLFEPEEYNELVKECNELKVSKDDLIKDWLDKL